MNNMSRGILRSTRHALAHFVRNSVLRMTRRQLLGITALLLAGTHMPITHASKVEAESVPRAFTLDVFLDDRLIGEQRFELAPTVDGLRVESDAAFEVRILGIRAFAYAHRHTELWRDDCLLQIESTTNSNGKKFSVSGTVRPAAQADLKSGGLKSGDQVSAFTVSASPEVSSVSKAPAGCIGSFAYWDKARLMDRQFLLNPQTGEYMPVNVQPRGESVLTIDGQDFRVEQLVITGKDIDITLAYAKGTGDWLGLDSRVESGRVLRYRRSADELPRQHVVSGTP